MPRIKLKVSMNRGEHGVPLKKFRAIIETFHEYINMMAEDLDIETDWGIEHFEEINPLMCDIVCSNEQPVDVVTKFNNSCSMVPDFEENVDILDKGIRPKTIEKLLDIAPYMDLNEDFSFGIYANGAVNWKNINRNGAERIKIVLDDAVRNRPDTSTEIIQYYGTVIGKIKSWFLEVDDPYFWLRDITTGERVKCFYKPEKHHRRVSELTMGRNETVIVSGIVFAKRSNNKIEKIDAVEFDETNEFTEADLDRLTGSAPGITGELTTAEFISYLRDEDG